MNKLSRFIIWICSKFTRNEIEFIVDELLNILKNNTSAIKPRDDFKEQHPNYRNYDVDPNLPLSEPKIKKKK